MVKFDYVLWLGFPASDADGVRLKRPGHLFKERSQLKGLSRSNTQFNISSHEKSVNALLALSSHFLAHGY